MAALPKWSFSLTLFLFQILLLALFAKYAVYGTSNSRYPQFQDVHVMIFFGFGFLMTFLKKYGFGAITYNFLLSAVVIQWATLMNAFVRQRVLKEEGHLPNTDPNIVEISVPTLMTSDFTAASVLITFGAVLGKASRLQLFAIAVIECIFFAVNEAVIVEYLHISDVGGSILVHLFGAYFGLAVSFVLQNSGNDHPKESSTKTSDLFSMAGTLFLWMFWPSFNSGPLTAEADQTRAIVNTYFALAACVVTTMVVSPLVDRKYRANMVHIQNATLAGGVAVGTSADLLIQPWGAILIGMIAGSVSVIGYAYVTPFLSSKLKIHDTCGVNNLHGMPALLAAIFAAIAAPAIGNDGIQHYTKTKSGEWSLKKQGGFQIAAALVALSISVVGGFFTGMLVKLLDGIDVEDDLYDDEREFFVPNDDEEGNVHEMKTVDA